MNQLHDRFVLMDHFPSFEILILFYFMLFSSKKLYKIIFKNLMNFVFFCVWFNLETIITILQLVFVISNMESYKIFSNLFIYVNEEFDDCVKPQNKMWFAHSLLVEFYDECWIQKNYKTKETIFYICNKLKPIIQK
jgi:hypothetical protein